MYEYNCINILNNKNQSILYNYIYDYFFCCFNNFDEYINIDYKNSIDNITKVNTTFYSQLIENFYKKINFTNNIEEYEFPNLTIKNFKNFIEDSLINYPETTQIFYIILSIFFFDYNLMFLFGSKARWFQLHSLINLIVTINILPGLLNMINNPLINNNTINSNLSTYYILFLHIYHILIFKNLTFYDYFHHILFVGFGVLPTLLFAKSNFYYFAYIACGGIPGIIEYGTLSLLKNNIITLNNQKKINSLLYNYFRYPLCVFGVSYNFIAYKIGKIHENLFLVIYLNFLLYFNGALFNYLTLESYTRIKVKNENNHVIYSKKINKTE